MTVRRAGLAGAGAALVAGLALQTIGAVPAADPERFELASVAPLVDRVRAAVVNVEVVARVTGRPRGDEELFDLFFGPRDRPRFRQGLGSGVIVDRRGRILSNQHVVEGAQSIRVRLDDGRAFDARVLGGDSLTDLALLALVGSPDDLPSVPLGDSDALRVGDGLVAIGNPFGLASSVSVGILSARARDIQLGPLDDFLQTDAAINPGNSGGPLFSGRGEVVGIATAIVGGGSGIGFAVPSNTARTLLPQLETGAPVRRGWLGLAAQDLTPDLARALGVPVHRGAVVAEVVPGSPADRADLRGDDVVTSLDGKPIDGAQGLTRRVAMVPPGTDVRITVQRGASRLERAATLGARPDPGEVQPVRGSNPPVPDRSPADAIGLTFRDVDPRIGAASGAPPRGAWITDVLPGSAADRADLRPGMVVVEAAGRPVRSAADLARNLRNAPRGSALLLRIRVDGARLLRALVVP